MAVIIAMAPESADFKRVYGESGAIHRRQGKASSGDPTCLEYSGVYAHNSMQARSRAECTERQHTSGQLCSYEYQHGTHE